VTIVFIGTAAIHIKIWVI